MTTPVFRFLSAVSAGIGLLSLCLLFTAPAGERGTVFAYATITLLIAALLRLVRGRSNTKPS